MTKSEKMWIVKDKDNKIFLKSLSPNRELTRGRFLQYSAIFSWGYAHKIGYRIKRITITYEVPSE